MGNKEKNKKILLFVIPMVLLISIISFSYAYWMRTSTQTNENILVVGACMDAELTNVTEAIGLFNEFPRKNDVGMQRNPYTFKITNTCNNHIIIDIALEVLETSSMAHEYIRTSLQGSGITDDNSSLLNDFFTRSATIPGAESYTLKEGVILEPHEEQIYDLRLWIEASTPWEEGNSKEFRSKIVIISTIYYTD